MPATNLCSVNCSSHKTWFIWTLWYFNGCGYINILNPQAAQLQKHWGTKIYPHTLRDVCSQWDKTVYSEKYNYSLCILKLKMEQVHSVGMPYIYMHLHLQLLGEKAWPHTLHTAAMLNSTESESKQILCSSHTLKKITFFMLSTWCFKCTTKVNIVAEDFCFLSGIHHW